MKIRNHTTALPLAVLASFALAVGAANAANLLTNGDFEGNSLTGWTLTGTTTVSSTLPLAGTYSAVQGPSAGGSLTQSFTAQTVGATASFIFTATDPGGAADRSMNVYFGQSGGSTNRINLRLVDLDADGDGDVQIFDQSTTWTTVLTNAVTFGSSTTFSLTINNYGGSFGYDLNVGGNTATGLSFFQNAAPTDFGVISFVNSSNATGTTFKFDNVSVVPEPSAALLGGLGGLLLLRRRRN